MYLGEKITRKKLMKMSLQVKNMCKFQKIFEY